MQQAVIERADITTEEGRSEFIRTTQIPLPDEPMPESHHFNSIEEVMEAMPLPVVIEVPPSSTPPRRKRVYVKVTAAQRDELTRYYEEHKDEWDDQRYSVKVGIKLDNCRRLLSILRSGGDISSSATKKGRRQKLNQGCAERIVKAVEEDSTRTLTDLCSILASTMQVVVSPSTLSRFLSNPSHYHVDMPAYTFKRTSRRDINANDDATKELRKQRVIEQANCIFDGCLQTYVDESAVELNSIRNYGWAPKGVNAFKYHRERILRTTAVTFISTKGVEYSVFIKGSINEEVFTSIFTDFIARFKEKRVFILDNARIHKPHLKEIAERSGSRVVFNAPNSPAMNPIEQVFGIWKSRAYPATKHLTNNDEILRTLARVLEEINSADVRKCITYVTNHVWPKIRNGEDI